MLLCMYSVYLIKDYFDLQPKIEKNCENGTTVTSLETAVASSKINELLNQQTWIAELLMARLIRGRMSSNLSCKHGVIRGLWKRGMTSLPEYVDIMENIVLSKSYQIPRMKNSYIYILT